MMSRITYDAACFALDLLEVDQYGLDKIDRRILQTLIVNFQGVSGWAWKHSGGRLLGRIPELWRMCMNPVCCRADSSIVLPAGRMASGLAYEHLGYAVPDKE